MSIEVLTIVCKILICVSFILFCFLCVVCGKLKAEMEENELLISDNTFLRSQIETQRLFSDSCVDTIERYREQIKYLQNIPKDRIIADGILEAVRYAMIHSHPDNGGDTEQFIKFKECYEKLKEGTPWN